MTRLCGARPRAARAFLCETRDFSPPRRPGPALFLPWAFSKQPGAGLDVTLVVGVAVAVAVVAVEEELLCCLPFLPSLNNQSIPPGSGHLLSSPRAFQFLLFQTRPALLSDTLLNIKRPRSHPFSEASSNHEPPQDRDPVHLYPRLVDFVQPVEDAAFRLELFYAAAYAACRCFCESCTAGSGTDTDTAAATCTYTATATGTSTGCGSYASTSCSSRTGTDTRCGS